MTLTTVAFSYFPVSKTLMTLKVKWSSLINFHTNEWCCYGYLVAVWRIYLQLAFFYNKYLVAVQPIG